MANNNRRKNNTEVELTETPLADTEESVETQELEETTSQNVEIQADADKSQKEVEEKMDEEPKLPSRVMATQDFSFSAKISPNASVTINCKENQIVTDPHLIELFIKNKMPVVEVE